MYVKRTKLLLIAFLIFIGISITFLYPNKPNVTGDVVKIDTTVCENLNSDNLRHSCKDIFKSCERNFDYSLSVYTCVSHHFIRENEDVAKEICYRLNDEYSGFFCFADVLREIDYQRGLEECKKIGNNDRKSFCEANVLKVIDKENAIKKCGKIQNNIMKNDCLKVVKD